MTKTDYVPGSDSSFDDFFQNIVKYIKEKTSGPSPVWSHIPLVAITQLAELGNAWHRAFVKTRGPHTSVDTKTKNDSRKAATAFLRPFVAQYLKFEPVTDEDRKAMRLHNRSTSHSPIPLPATRPLITELKALGGFQVKIRFRDETTPNSNAIPYGDNGCLLNFTVSTEQVTDYDALIRTQLMSDTPWTLSFSPEAAGTFLSCAVRWQSRKTKLGPWSEIHHIMIL
jgi:hypothetical protein